MAAPITHIVLADKIFSSYFKAEDKSDFYVGTSFPDIRYLGVIEKDKTHFSNLSIENIKNLPPFEAGLKFHSMVDEVRKRFVKSKHIYSLLPESPFVTQAFKFFEDKILYEKLNNWSEVTTYFNKVLGEEKEFGIKEKDIEKWHLFIRSYFSAAPEDKDITNFVAAINRPSSMAEEIIILNREMAKNERITEITLSLYENFESLL